MKSCTVRFAKLIRIGPGGRVRAVKELKVKYRNITYETVMLYLKLYKEMKHSAAREGIVLKPMVISELNPRCM